MKPFFKGYRPFNYFKANDKVDPVPVSEIMDKRAIELMKLVEEIQALSRKEIDVRLQYNRSVMASKIIGKELESIEKKLHELKNKIQHMD